MHKCILYSLLYDGKHFGSFLESTGTYQIFINLANAIAGKAVGEPARGLCLNYNLQGV